MRPRRRLRILAACAAAAAGSCAVDRKLQITTDPPGAEVFVDGLGLGTSPVSFPFTHYGTRRVRVELAGFHPHDELVPLVPPWYGAFPFDLFSEVLIPIWRTDVRDFAVTLRRKNSDDDLVNPDATRVESEAIRRARALRRWIPEEPPPRPPEK